ncbi:MAG: DUF167 domain-containing protein [Proteobacteria bacterium]|nr:DUF167 domain-containing protein [Pseudomonadota bacterium]
MAEGSPFLDTPGGTILNVKLTPKASKNRIGPVVVDADGNVVLKIAVTAAPEDGKANQALIKLLAKTWRLPKTAVSVKKGATDRRKTLLVETPIADVLKKFEENS